MATPAKKPKKISDRLNEAFGQMVKKNRKDAKKGGCNCSGKGTCPACRGKSSCGD